VLRKKQLFPLLLFDRSGESTPFSNFEMSTPKVLVADPISERGIAELAEGKLLQVDVQAIQSSVSNILNLV
jgi:hypothetical protein